MIDTSTPTRTRQRQAEELRERARSLFLANRALGEVMTGEELGAACGGMSGRWGRARIQEALAAEGGTDGESSPAVASSAPGRNATAQSAPEPTSLPPVLTPPAHPEPSPEAAVPAAAEQAAPVASKRHEGGTARRPRLVRVWPVWLLMLPATVAIWSGWVGLGELAGFGPVRPLPGIVDSFEINSAITLPIGMEVYAGYALYVWLSGRASGRALRMARTSAIAALVVGAAGQVAYHVMVAAGVGVAPWWITAGVACLPVAVLGMGAALAHMVRAEADAIRSGAAAVPHVPS